MIKTIRIETLDEAMKILTEQTYTPSMDRYRSLNFYRGMPDASYRLDTSLRRNCKDLQRRLEPAILRNFTKYAVIDDPYLASSVWKQMIIGQQHGLPTRLLDWTFSPLIGLHFSTTEPNMDDTGKRDGVVWRIDAAELHALLPEDYRMALKKGHADLFTINILNEIAPTLDAYDASMGDCAMALIEPPSFDPRIINQYSYFSIIPNAMDDIEGFLDRHTNNTVRYIISRDLRWRIRDMLDQLNVNERIVYPGLDGLSKWLARHYYVRRERHPDQDGSSPE